MNDNGSNSDCDSSGNESEEKTIRAKIGRKFQRIIDIEISDSEDTVNQNSNGNSIFSNVSSELSIYISCFYQLILSQFILFIAVCTNFESKSVQAPSQSIQWLQQQQR